MKRYKANFNKDRHPRMIECSIEVCEMFETQSREDLCEALARLLDEHTQLKASYKAAISFWSANSETKDLELRTLTQTLEEREEELRKLTGASLIKCQCQIETETLN